MKHFRLLFAFVLVSAIGFSQSKEEAYQDLKAYVESREFTFTADWATTQKGNRVNLMNNPNFVKVSSDKIAVAMPYFGEVQVASYGSGGGIAFEKENPNIKMDFNDKKRRVTLQFSGNNNSESFQCNLTIFPNRSASLIINSNKRNSISYTGKVLDSENY